MWGLWGHTQLFQLIWAINTAFTRGGLNQPPPLTQMCSWYPLTIRVNLKWVQNYLISCILQLLCWLSGTCFVNEAKLELSPNWLGTRNWPRKFNDVQLIRKKHFQLFSAEEKHFFSIISIDSKDIWSNEILLIFHFKFSASVQRNCQWNAAACLLFSFSANRGIFLRHFEIRGTDWGLVRNVNR